MFPSGTVTVAGTLARVLLLESETVSPPTGAGAVNVIVPWTGSPPDATLVDNSRFCSVEIVTTVVVSTAVWLTLE